MQMKNNSGISMITIVITIIVIIILTTISIETSSKVPDEANFTKYRQEIKNVQTGVESAKVKNAAKGTSEAKLNAGFKKVYLEEAPASFVSFGESDELIRGYLVDLETIGYKEAEYGQAYVNYAEGDTLTFGGKEYDVFVYDAEWNVYYVKGLKYDGSMNYTIE